MAKIFIIFISLYSIAKTPEHNCEFYYNLKNAECKRHNSYINLAHRFCLKFEDRKSKFSDNGQFFLESVNSCLINELENEDLSSCNSLKRIAAKHHVKCYLENGFCDLSKKDKWNLIKILKFNMLRRSFLKQEFKVLRECLF